MQGMKRDRYVYMIDGADGQPCYVGVGKGTRMHYHLATAKNGHSDGSARADYFLKCVEDGYIFTPYKTAEHLTIEEACDLERNLIERLGRLDKGTGPLINTTSGGHGVRDKGVATKQKLSERIGESLNKFGKHQLEPAISGEVTLEDVTLDTIASRAVLYSGGKSKKKQPTKLQKVFIGANISARNRLKTRKISLSTIKI